MKPLLLFLCVLMVALVVLKQLWPNSESTQTKAERLATPSATNSEEEHSGSQLSPNQATAEKKFPGPVTTRTERDRQAYYLKRKERQTHYQKKIADLNRDREKLEIQANRLRDTPKAELVRVAAGLDLPNNRVLFHYQQHRMALDEVASLRAKGLDDNHPEVKISAKKATAALELAEGDASHLEQVLRVQSKMIEDTLLAIE